MTGRNILVIGAGLRVQRDLLPVLRSLDRLYTLVGIFEEEARTITSEGVAYETAPLDDLDAETLSRCDLVHLAVTKGAVPSVLRTLARHDMSQVDLLVDTPVLLFKHFAHAALFQKFRKVWVSEDCPLLPCFDPMLRHPESTCGELQEVIFHQSAYKYHGLAALKALLKCNTITRASRRKEGQGQVRRTVQFANKTMGAVIEPRDYGTGHFVLKGSLGAVTDQQRGGGEARSMAPVKAGDSWKGFRVGDCATTLTPEETALMGTEQTRASITARMDNMKNVGLYRLLQAIHEGKGGYPLEEALDDMVIDYYLDRLGFFRAGPLMSIKSGLGRALLKTFTKIVGGR
jgi:hypothetical protein